MRILIGVAAAVVLLGSVTACARTIDPAATNATLVPGTSSLYRFCDGANLIYFSKVDGDHDQFEFFVPAGCDAPPPVVTAPSTAPSTTATATIGGGR